jgi:hypothetical protein
VGACRRYARAEQEPIVEDNCLISIVPLTTSASSALERCTASRHD